MKRFFFSTTLLLYINIGFAQPCLSPWKYRVPVIIDNSGSSIALTNYQVKIQVNTQTLISSGKLNIDGSDLRILDQSGSLLAHWIEKGTINNANTTIWVKIPNIPSSSSVTVYMFYGNTGALSGDDGINTFDLFDDFDNASLDLSKWSFCNGGTLNIANSIASFTSTNASTGKALIYSNASVPSVSIAEMFVVNLGGSNTGGGFLGQFNDVPGNYSGYTMFYQNTSGSGSIRIRKSDINSPCTDQADPSSPNSSASFNTYGIWSLVWPSQGVEKMDWPGALIHPTTVNDISFNPTLSQRVFIGNTQLAGNIGVDWIRTRKYTSNVPVTSLGIETDFVTQLQVINSGPVCEGGNVQLFVNGINGATYTWTGPSAFTSSSQNPIINGIGINDGGQYSVSVSIPNCVLYTASTVVTVNSLSVGGNTSGAAQLCSGNNSGIISLTGNNGDIIRWESSESGNDPWTTISNTNIGLPYLNLVTAAYYRAVVKNGACVESGSTSSYLQTFPATKGGKVLGAVSVCEGNNNGSITLSDYIGGILKWQSSINNFTTSSDINLSSESINFNNLTKTTWFRAKVESGNCLPAFSEAVQIIITPKPAVNFSSAQVCQGTPSLFLNTTTISSGRLNTYNWDFGDGNVSALRNPKYVYGAPGFYTTKLYVTSDRGCLDSASAIVSINAIPTVDFLFNNVCDKDPASFSSQSTILNGSITQYLWKFGDGLASQGSNVSHTYPVTGTFLVKHILVSDKNCKDSITHPITVYPRANVNFTSANECIGNPNSFLNKTIIQQGYVSYIWLFGDGSGSSEINPFYTYSFSGTYSVTLQALTSNNCTDSFTANVIVFPGPKSSFMVQDVCENIPANFVNSSSISNGILFYTWLFGDGTTSQEVSPSHLYLSPGSYNVSLTAKTENNCSSTTSKGLKINPIPSAAFLFAEACDKDSIKFSNQSSISSGSLSYVWNFSDGIFSNKSEPAHLFDSSSVYKVKLTASSSFGCTDSVTKNVNVNPLPVPNFEIPTVCFKYVSKFTNKTNIKSGSIVNYSWDFGDGTNSIQINPVKEYLFPGNYNVTLLTISDKGCRKDTIKTAVVKPLPVAGFTNHNVCVNKQDQFTNTSTLSGDYLTYSWDFRDNHFSQAQDPIHIFSDSGKYNVQLTAISSFGCKDTVINPVIVYPPPAISAGSDTLTSQGYGVELNASGGKTYVWVPFETLNKSGVPDPIATPLQTTSYTVTGTDIFGCTNTSMVTVTVILDYKLMVSNVVTPDGNGSNDYWFVENIETFQNSKVYIYDRWGNEVYKKKGYKNDWDGSAGNDILPDATYYYLIDLGVGDKTYKGAITILRNKN